jgi:hypothetical protein
MKRGRAAAIMGEVLEAVKQWPEFAARAKLSDALRERIQKQHRLDFPKG